jgi:hypothetical protein
MSKDGEIEAVDSSEASGTWIKHISIFWIIDVELQPGCAESFLYTVVLMTTTWAPSGFLLSFFLLLTLSWTDHLKFMLSSDNDSSVIIFVLHPSC